MFHPPEYISLREVYQTVDATFREKSLGGRWSDFSGDDAFELSWDFAESASQLWTVNSSGEILEISKFLVKPDSPFDHSNEHVSLPIGTIGSGENGLVGAEKSLERKTAEYGPFLFLPILFLRDEFEEFRNEMSLLDWPEFDLAKIQASSVGTTSNTVQAREDQSPKAVAARIVRAVDDGTSLTFKLAHKTFSSHMSIRQFRLAWSLAAHERPTLSLPGRKKAFNPDA